LQLKAEAEAVDQAVSGFFEIGAALFRTIPDDRLCPCAMAMERYRKTGRVGEDWHSWIGRP
jgi:hypothetical protein